MLYETKSSKTISSKASEVDSSISSAMVTIPHHRQCLCLEEHLVRTNLPSATAKQNPARAPVHSTWCQLCQPVGLRKSTYSPKPLGAILVSINTSSSAAWRFLSRVQREKILNLARN
jgi:hypothetical protein